MKPTLLLLFGSLVVSSLTSPWAVAQNAVTASTQTPVEKPRVIAEWQFDGNGEDASGHHHNVRLRGQDTQYVTNGKRNGALSIGETNAPGDNRQGALVQNSDALNLTGAFTLEMWISPSEQLAQHAHAVLLDKKYHNSRSTKSNANTAYMLRLAKVDEKQFQLEAQLGFGQDSAVVQSRPYAFQTNQWYQIAFTYDGKGDCRFYVNQLLVGQTTLKDRGSITPGTYNLIIGDRVASVGQRFLGRIDDVRIVEGAMKYISGQVLLDAANSRRAFYRKEENAAITLHITNDRRSALTHASAQIHIDGNASKAVPLPQMAPGESIAIDLPFNSDLRPAAYDAKVLLQSEGDTVDLSFALTIVPRPLPHQMPIVMWARATRNYQELADIGYTHEFVTMIDYNHVFTNGTAAPAMPPERAAGVRQQLDDMLAAGVGGLASLNPGATISQLHPEWNRVDRKGQPIVIGTNNKRQNLDALYPQVQELAALTGKSVASTFGDLPGLAGTHINGEIRDRTALSFHQIDHDAYRQFSGAEIPNEADGAQGVDYRNLKNFPANHIIADDDPLLTFYKWFWRKGDGWTDYVSAISDGFKTAASKSTFTMMDPGVRVPSLWGSGGTADFINQWTYTYPNPLKNDLATNEMLAMAAGNPEQKVMNMVQIIWYRSGTTEPPAAGHETAWEKVSPDAKFISIAPDHLSEATWLELAYPIDAIANHGWGSLGDHLGFKQGSYITTNTETRQRMTHLYQNVVKPLAPTLLQVGDYPTDVAFLQSFSSQIFAKTGTYGWGGGWGADSYFVARYAGLQPQIIYEETIQKSGLDRYKVLFLTDCPVLPQSVANAIIDFQKKGGIIIGDEDIAPGIAPDILLTKANRAAPQETKRQWQSKAATLMKELAPFYQAPLQNNNPDVITRLRQSGKGLYLFTINDHRTYGDYVGQYKKVMEKGLPSQFRIRLNRAAGHIYDLTQHREVATTSNNGKLEFAANLAAGEGNVLLLLDNAVGQLSAIVPPTAQRGNLVPIKIQLKDSANQPLDAVIPLQVTVRNAQNRRAEQSGFYGAPNGTLELDLDIAPNDTPGQWQLEVTESLTGQTVTKSFVVQ